VAQIEMKSPGPHIEVIVRVTDRPILFITRALASIRAQTFGPAGVIVIITAVEPEGWSGLLAAKPLGDIPLRCLALPAVRPEGNRAAALNAGIAASTGEWIAFLDDDDTWHPTLLAEMIAVLSAQPCTPDLGGVVCHTEAVYERVKNGSVQECGREPFNPWLAEVTPGELFKRNGFTINAALWHRRVFDQLKGFSEEFPVLEDWEFNMRAARQFRLTVLSRALARYHQRPPDGSVPNTSWREHDRVTRRLRAVWLQSGVGTPGSGIRTSWPALWFGNLVQAKSRLVVRLRWWGR
jgi:hypothetical protein